MHISKGREAGLVEPREKNVHNLLPSMMAVKKLMWLISIY